MNLKELTNEELIELYQQTKDEVYITRLYKNNHRLITSFVSKRTSMDSITLSREDYISECNLAFMTAVNNFSIDKTVKFSSYLYTCITNTCNQLIRHSNMQKRYCKYTNIPYHSKLNIDSSSLYVYDTVKYDENVFLDYVNIDFDENDAYQEIYSKLTKYQRETLRLLNEGLTQLEIANKLNKSHQNISASVKHIRRIATECGYAI